MKVGRQLIFIEGKFGTAVLEVKATIKSSCESHGQLDGTKLS
jgi:hypothetical protein